MVASNVPWVGKVRGYVIEAHEQSPLFGNRPVSILSNGEPGTPVGVLALVACTRHRVEEFFEDGKSFLGMSQYETRSWAGWHHHMSWSGRAPVHHAARLKKNNGPAKG